MARAHRLGTQVIAPRWQSFGFWLLPLLFLIGLERLAVAAPPVPEHLSLFPPVAEVPRAVRGKDPIDTAAKQEAAFRSLSVTVRALSARGIFAQDHELSAAELALMKQYGQAGQSSSALAPPASALCSCAGPPESWACAEGMPTGERR